MRWRVRTLLMLAIAGAMSLGDARTDHAGAVNFLNAQRDYLASTKARGVGSCECDTVPPASDRL